MLLMEAIVFYTSLLLPTLICPVQATVYSLSSNWELNIEIDSVTRTVNSLALQQAYADQQKHIVWEAPPDAPFLQASQGTVSISSENGSFDVRETETVRTDTLHITGVSQGSQQDVTLHGQIGLSQNHKPASSRLTCNFTTTFSVSSLTPSSVSATSLLAACSPPDLQLTHLTLTSYAPPASLLLGCGALYSLWDLRGTRFAVITQEQGVGRGLFPATEIANSLISPGAGGNWHTTYSAIPYVVVSGKSEKNPQSQSKNNDQERKSKNNGQERESKNNDQERESKSNDQERESKCDEEKRKSNTDQEKESKNNDQERESNNDQEKRKSNNDQERESKYDEGERNNNDEERKSKNNDRNEDTVLRGIVVENHGIVVVDAGKRAAGRLEMSVLQVGKRNQTEPLMLKMRMIGAAVDKEKNEVTPLSMVEALTELTGRMQPLPHWTSTGAIVGWEGGTAAARAYWKQLRDAGVPVAALWLQDWSGRVSSFKADRVYWNWNLDSDYYPNWPQFVDEVESAGGRMLLYVNPYLSTLPPPSANRTWQFGEAHSRGFLVLNATGQPYIQYSVSKDFTFGTVDFTNPAARQWFAEQIRSELIEKARGAGAMADFGEYLPFDATVYSQNQPGGMTASTAHNAFPELWSSVTQAADSTALFFHRSMSLSSPGFTRLHWMGDQLTTYDIYDGLVQQIRNAIFI